MTGPRFQRDVGAADVVASLEEHGYAIVEKRADAETLRRLNAEFDPYIEAVQLGKTEFAGNKTKRINNLIDKSEACWEFAGDPLIMAVCDEVLLPYCARYHLHVTTLIELQPGQSKQWVHRDGNIYPVRFPTIPMTLGTIWACNDFTAENGATQIAPGSHRWAHEREPKPDELISADMPAGSVLIYTSNFYHGGGENLSNGTRRGMALHYNLGWLRQEENQYLSLPPDKAAKLPTEIRKLVGYDFGGPYLGFVEEGHPLTLTDPDLPRDMDRGGDPELARNAAAINPVPVGGVAPGTWD